MLQGVAALTSFCAQGRYHAVQFSLPEAKGVLGNAGPVAHFLNGQGFHWSSHTNFPQKGSPLRHRGHGEDLATDNCRQKQTPLEINMAPRSRE